VLRTLLSQVGQSPFSVLLTRLLDPAASLAYRFGNRFGYEAIPALIVAIFAIVWTALGIPLPAVAVGLVLIGIFLNFLEEVSD